MSMASFGTNQWSPATLTGADVSARKMSASESTPPTFKDLIKKTTEISIQSDSNGSTRFLGGEDSGCFINGGKVELWRFLMVERKEDFKCMKRVHGRMVNVLGGLELHTGVFNAAE